MEILQRNIQVLRNLNACRSCRARAASASSLSSSDEMAWRVRSTVITLHVNVNVKNQIVGTMLSVMSRHASRGSVTRGNARVRTW